MIRIFQQKQDEENACEIFPIVTEEGIQVGKATREECHNGSKLLHPVVHLHVIHPESGALLLQKRPVWKDIQPNKWDTAVGGHVDEGEAIQDALMREVSEEIGITNFRPEFVTSYVFESDIEKELVYVYRTYYGGDFNPNHEVDALRFWLLSNIEKGMEDTIFTPNFTQEWDRLQIVEWMQPLF